MDGNKTKSEIIVSLFELDTVKFGNFILKSKTTSPVYIDFRGIISSPDLMVLWQKANCILIMPKNRPGPALHCVITTFTTFTKCHQYRPRHWWNSGHRLIAIYSPLSEISALVCGSSFSLTLTIICAGLVYTFRQLCTCTCTCRCRAVEASALNAPLLVQPFLETISG